MTGPEHYRIAEDLAASCVNRDIPGPEVAARTAIAQVHATLALAAATAIAGGRSMHPIYSEAWEKAAGTWKVAR